MKLVYKICLITATFFTLAGVAWAGFNYQSLNNYFLIDSVFKSGGDYILVGDALGTSLKGINSDGISTPTSAFFAASNNIILGKDAKFCTGDSTCTGSRQIQKTSGGIYDFKTNSISIDNNNPLEISSQFGRGDNSLHLKAGAITSDKDFLLKDKSKYGSLTFSSSPPGTSPISNSIYARFVAANQIRKFGGLDESISISSETQVSLISSIRPKEMRTITVTGVAAGSPVAITLPPELMTSEKMRSDGWDLKFYADEASARAGSDSLSFFLDTLPKVWVKMPATGTIYMTYGGIAPKTNPSNPNAVFTVNAVSAVWGSAEGVELNASFNFDETGGKILENSVFGPGGDLSPITDESTMRVQGKINRAIKTSGNQFIRLTNGAIPLGTEWAIDTWIQTPLNSAPNYNVLAAGYKDAIVAAVPHRDGDYIGLYLGTWQEPPKSTGWNACDRLPAQDGIQGYNLKTLTSGWHHLVAIGHDSSTDFYLDGEQVCTSAYKSLDSILYLGNLSTGGRSWGAFDEFRVYSKVLPPTFITQESSNCAFTTLALPTKILIKPCATTTTLAFSAGTCLQDCDNASLANGLVTEAKAIKYTQTGQTTTTKDFCYVKKWDTTNDIPAATAIKASSDGMTMPASGNTCGSTDDSANDTTKSRRACCDADYYVFDFDANAGKMVCCRYNPLAPAP